MVLDFECVSWDMVIISVFYNGSQNSKLLSLTRLYYVVLIICL